MMRFFQNVRNGCIGTEHNNIANLKCSCTLFLKMLFNVRCPTQYQPANFFDGVCQLIVQWLRNDLCAFRGGLLVSISGFAGHFSRWCMFFCLHFFSLPLFCPPHLFGFRAALGLVPFGIGHVWHDFAGGVIPPGSVLTGIADKGMGDGRVKISGSPLWSAAACSTPSRLRKTEHLSQTYNKKVTNGLFLLEKIVK